MNIEKYLKLFLDNCNENYLSTKLPPKVLVSISSVIVCIAFVVVIFCCFVRLPEVVEAHFVLEPKGGIETLRSEQDGSIVTVKVKEGDYVETGQVLFVMHSEIAVDRSSELSTLEAKLVSAKKSFENLANQAKLDQDKYLTAQKILASKKESANRELAFQFDKQKYALNIFENSNKASAAISAKELQSLKLDVDGANKQVAVAQKDLDVIDLEIKELEAKRAKEISQYQEDEVAIKQDITSSENKLVVLRQREASLVDKDLFGKLAVKSPVNGTVYKLLVKRSGGYVAEGETLAEIAPSNDQLVARLEVPENGLGKFYSGQSVKLLFDAFPYQRYGVGHAKVAWISPVIKRNNDNNANSGLSLEAQAELLEYSIVSGDRDVAYTPGMSGTARIAISSNTLLGYMLEPLRTLKERIS